MLSCGPRFVEVVAIPLVGILLDSASLASCFGCACLLGWRLLGPLVFEVAFCIFMCGSSRLDWVSGFRFFLGPLLFHFTDPWTRAYAHALSHSCSRARSPSRPWACMVLNARVGFLGGFPLFVCPCFFAPPCCPALSYPGVIAGLWRGEGEFPLPPVGVVVLPLELLCCLCCAFLVGWA